MELWHWADCKVNIAVIDYYYGRARREGHLQADHAPSRSFFARCPAWAPPKVAGAIEGETMKIIKKTGTPEPQNWEGMSDEKHLWWRGAKPKDELVLGFDVPKAGKYQVFGRFLKAVDYGIVQLAVNGEKAGEPIDFYNDGVVAVARNAARHVRLERRREPAFRRRSSARTTRPKSNTCSASIT